MRVRIVAFLLLIISTLAPSARADAAVLDSQTNSSSFATRPSASAAFLTFGYIPSQAITISGVRFRVQASSTALCPSEVNVSQHDGTTTPPAASDMGRSKGVLFPVSTTTPDSSGNCDYTAFNNNRNGPLPLLPNYYYVFLADPGWSSRTWVSFAGKPFASSMPVSFFGFRNAFSNFYEWGTTGLDAPYFQFFDTTPYTPELPVPVPALDPCVAAGNCVSNVLFLPGIQGSRLYTGAACGGAGEEKLWEPLGENIISILRGAGDEKVRKLFLDQSGTSTCSDIYVKKDDVVDSVAGGNIYKSFIEELTALEASSTIRDFEAVAYDWRLSLPDLLTKGAERDGKVFYTEATSTPYIEQTLRSLAASSKTGKVTLVAHSNGGLVTKALLERLGGETSKSLVDKVIFVGVPQSGAPASLAALLVGHNAGIYKLGLPIVSNAVAREFMQNSPMAYHLLPSEAYLESVAGDTAHPLVRFAGEGYAKERTAYGDTIDTLAELDSFLLAREGGRADPPAQEVNQLEVLSASLLDYAHGQHATLDVWSPPVEIAVTQVTGWGVDTVAGIEFYTSPAISALTSAGPVRSYRPIFTEDGDGTVPIPSALMMASSTNVKRYWVNLFAYNNVTQPSRNHKDLFEISSVRDFVKNIVTSGTSTPSAHVSTTQPAPETGNKRLNFFLHSPLTLQITDSFGNTTGIAADGSMTEGIPDSSYGEFGEVKYISVPAGSQYSLSMQGEGSGTFSLDIQETLGGTVTASSTIANVPVATSTLASLTITSDLSTASELTVDVNGNGSNVLTINPVVGQTVVYAPPASVSISTPKAEPIIVSAGGGSASVASVAPTTPPATTTEQILATSTEKIATTTPVLVAVKPVQIKKKPVIPPAVTVKSSPKPIGPQTAAVYDASQQLSLKKLGATVYNGLHGFWSALKKLF